MFASALRTIAVGMVLVGTTGFATAAATYNLGTLNTTVAESGIGIDGPFDHVFKFTLGSLPGVAGTIAGIDFLGDLTAQYRFGVGPTAEWGSWSSLAVPSDSDGLFAFSDSAYGLTPGETYWFELSGSATYAAYAVTLIPVPEPGTMALMLSGLGLIGATVRRRKNTH